jgi:hypothetical protein
VPEFEARRTSVPPFTPPLRRDDDRRRVDRPPPDESGSSPTQREGLPPGYRMRHDAHYVDQLTTRVPPAPHIRLIPLSEIDTARGGELPDLEPLVRSVARHGVLQPLLVRPADGRFELIAGSRRLRAAARAGLAEVPCFVHACDQTRAAALAEAENLRRPAPAPRRSGEMASGALRELQQSFGGIASCLHLIAGREASLRDRVALDLIRTEAHRAHRLVQCLHLLTGERPLAPAAVSVRAALEQALEAFAPERRLSAAQISVDCDETLPAAHADPEWLTIALTAAIGGMLSMVQGATVPLLRIKAATAMQSVTVAIEQHAVPVPEHALTRFFDAAWVDRPGGYQAAVEFAAARSALERLGGSVEIHAEDGAGCRLTLAVPRERRRP